MVLALLSDLLAWWLRILPFARPALVRTPRPRPAPARTYANTRKQVRRAPRLLTNSIDSLRSNLEAIQRLLPEADAAALARGAPTLVLASTASLAPKVRRGAAVEPTATAAA